MSPRTASFVFGAGVLIAVAAVATPAPPSPRAYPPGSAAVVGAVYLTESGMRFVHCPTYAQYPIAHESAFDELAFAVAALELEAGRSVIVSLMARLQPMPIVEGKPPRDQMVVDGVLRVWPDETCEKVRVETPLANTYWKLIELDGKPYQTHEEQKEVHLLLRADSDEVKGFGGCGPIAGRYHPNGVLLSFVGMSSGESTCPFRKEEEAFLKALGRVTSYQIVGQALDLRNDAGPVALFRAVYF